jgi:Ser/Thr protein kinase RdoA (MazF antagonist)
VEVVPRADADAARRVAARLGLPTAPVEELVGLGSVNRVFVLGRAGDRYVVRFALDPLRTEEFSVEDWCLRVATTAGIPSPAPVAHGVLDRVPYGVQRFVEHVELDGLDRRDLWRLVGRYARRIHELPVPDDAPPGLFSRFGRDLPVAWQAHLAYNLSELAPGDPLVGLGVYAAADRPRLLAVIAGLSRADLSFGLSHGDLATRNLLRRSDGALVLLDWGSASCGPVPYRDLLTLTAGQHEDGDPSPDDLAAFATGYDLDLDQLDHTLRAMRVLTALDLVRWALEHRPDRLSELVASARDTLTRFADE